MTRSQELASRLVPGVSARRFTKRSVHRALLVRGRVLARAGRLPEPANLFAASSPKAGSQWAKALLDHPVVRARTRLVTLPQLDYQVWRPGRAFPLGTFVPGLYLSWEEYQRIPKPASARTFYVFRDPREVVVSAYYSATETHPRMPGETDERDRLRALPLDEALLYTIELMAGRLREMATWVEADDPAVACFRLEEINAAPEAQVPAILRHCGVTLTRVELETLLADTSRSSLQRRDLARRRPGSESHYRVRRTGFRELFDERHHRALDAVSPGLVGRLGYAP